MIGAVAYELTAVDDGRMEGFAGRLLHAAFFRHLARCSASFSQQIHDETNIKPFAVSPLMRPQVHHEMIVEKEPFLVSAGAKFFWRVSALQDAIFEAALMLGEGASVQVGHVPFIVTAVHADGAMESGGIEPEELIASALEAPQMQDVTFTFRSPVTFRRGTLDATLPAPELVFPSLADKWTQAGMPGSIEKASVRQIAQEAAPSDWRGRTQRVYFGRRYGANGCVGSFTYQLKGLRERDQKILSLLAQYANISGVGRLTAQGFGQARTSFR